VPLLHGGAKPGDWRGAFLVEQEKVYFAKGGRGRCDAFPCPWMCFVQEAWRLL
jgi:hypothetical protein